MVRVDALSNSGHTTVLSTLRTSFTAAPVSSVRAAISFIMASGTAHLGRDLERLIDGGARVTVIFGDDFHLTQSAALSRLMGIGSELRLYSGETHDGYHPKMWIVDYVDGSRTVVVGSSNLSHGGLLANAEAGVVLHGPSADLRAFEEVWDSLLADSHQFTNEDLKSYIDSEKTAAVPPRRRARRVSSEQLAPAVRAHIERWQRFIEDPYRIGQSERWRGWYLVPEQGQLTDSKLLELSTILDALHARPQYARDGQVSLGTNAEGVTNASAALATAGVTTRHSYTDRQRRDLFVRQQRLYLQTFGWLEQIDQDRFRVTRRGDLFRGAKTARRRSRLFTEALSMKKWPFGPLTFYPYLLDVLERAPDRRLYYDELNLIVIHSYHRSELPGIVNLVAEYRTLDDVQRASFHQWADQRLRSLLTQHAGGTAYGRYRRKIADLMVAFGSTTGIEYHPSQSEDRSYIRLT